MSYSTATGCIDTFRNGQVVACPLQATPRQGQQIDMTSQCRSHMPVLRVGLNQEADAVEVVALFRVLIDV